MEGDDLFARSENETDDVNKRQRISAVSGAQAQGTAGSLAENRPTNLAGVRGAMAVPADEASPAETPTSETAREQLNAFVKVKHDIKKIIDDLEAMKDPLTTMNRRQRRTLAQAKTDISEAYSPPRMAKMAAQMGMRPGWSWDLTSVDPDDGKPWDFSDPKKRAKALKMLEQNGPAMLVVCPMCGGLQRAADAVQLPEDVGGGRQGEAERRDRALEIRSGALH